MRSALVLLTLMGCTGVDDPDTETDTDSDTDATEPCDIPQSTDPTIAITTVGAVQGEVVGSVIGWKGVPFADPPARWRAPTPPTCWDGVLQTTEWPDRCMQVSFDGINDEDPVVQGSEDCLYLNVWAPSEPAGPRPVMVYIHGGGNQQGSSSQEQGGAYVFEGDLLADEADAVVVTLQYRLGPLGFLTHPALDDEQGRAGNYGLLDQIRGLQWVQDNIEAFGGDPDRVMMFGESGGAVDTCFLTTSPLAKDLFSSALMQSGACVAQDRATREGQALDQAEQAGCADPNDRACLEEVEVDTWLSQVVSPGAEGVIGQYWGAHIDGWVMPEDPLTAMAAGRHNRVPFVVGSNSDETALMTPPTVTPATVRAVISRFPQPQRDQLLALYPPGDSNDQARLAYIGLTTDAQFTCQARRIARAARDGQDEPVFRYFYQHRLATPGGARWGAVHGLELFYVFQTLGRSDLIPRGVPGEDQVVMDLMADAWGGVARDGRPGVAGGLEWPEFDGGEKVFVIEDEPSVMTDVRGEKCDVWDALVE